MKASKFARARCEPAGKPAARASRGAAGRGMDVTSTPEYLEWRASAAKEHGCAKQNSRWHWYTYQSQARSGSSVVVTLESYLDWGRACYVRVDNCRRHSPHEDFRFPFETLGITQVWFRNPSYKQPQQRTFSTHLGAARENQALWQPPGKHSLTAWMGDHVMEGALVGPPGFRSQSVELQGKLVPCGSRGWLPYYPIPNTEALFVLVAPCLDAAIRFAALVTMSRE